MSNKNIITVVTLAHLMGLLSCKKGAQFVTLTARTTPKLLKTGNDLGDVFKVNTVNACINFIYANAVNNQRSREDATPDFTPSPRKWGVRLKGLPFVTHKGKVYLETKVQKIISTRYEDANGNEIAYDLVKPFLPERNSNAAHQGVEKEIYIADYSIDTIQEISIGGEHLMVDADSIPAALEAVEMEVVTA